jgi:hypothetical protein
MPDDPRGIPWATFHPLGREGGYNSPDGRLVVKSGLFNRDRLRNEYGEDRRIKGKTTSLRDCAP